MPARRAPELAAGLHGRATARAGVAYRLLRLAFRAVGMALGFRLVIEGREHLPRDGGWIAVGVPHRTWIDPFVIWVALPAQPRLTFFGDARAMARSRVRRIVIRVLGGVVPIPSGGGARAFAAHLGAAEAVIRAGGVFFLFPEQGPPTPPGTARPFGGGLGYAALRTGAPMVPIVLGGTHELFLGRRIVVRILRPVTATELLGLASPPPAGSHDERDGARRLGEAFHARTTPVIAEVHRAAEPPPGTRKRGRRLTTLFH